MSEFMAANGSVRCHGAFKNARPRPGDRPVAGALSFARHDNEEMNDGRRRSTNSCAGATISASLVHDAESGETALIDAPEEAPILAAIERTGWTPT